MIRKTPQEVADILKSELSSLDVNSGALSIEQSTLKVSQALFTGFLNDIYDELEEVSNFETASNVAYSSGSEPTKAEFDALINALKAANLME